MIERPLSEIEVTPETLPFLRQQIGLIREEKGREEETLRLIGRVRPEAIKLEEHEHVVNLYWEECQTKNGRFGGSRIRIFQLCTNRLEGAANTNP